MSKRDDLISAAVGRLLRGGIEAVTTTGVAADAGLSQAGVYRHFADVHELRAEAVARVSAAWFDRLEEQRRRLLGNGGPRGSAARQAYAEELGRHADADRSMRALIDRHRFDDDALGKRIDDLLGALVEDVSDYLVAEVSHEHPSHLGLVESRPGLVRFHAALFVDDALTLGRIDDLHGFEEHHYTARLLARRFEAGWLDFVDDFVAADGSAS